MADAPTPIESSRSFKKIEDPILQRSLIMDAVVTGGSFTALGVPGLGDQPIKGRFTQRSDGKQDFWVEILPESFDLFSKVLKNLEFPMKLRFSVFIKEQPVICFEAEVAECDLQFLHCKNPDKMFFIQRRSSRRYRVPAAYELWVEMQDPHYNKRWVKQRLFDISSGGISFLVGIGESRFYTTGLQMHPAYISLKGQRYIVGLEVRVNGKEIVRLGDSNGIVVGCQFVKVDQPTQEAIDLYVEEGFIKGKTGRHSLE
jgi:hypothetical protein